jgi:GT2 family glycosyltransferase
MKIAAISITYNDDYKLNEWIRYYNEYQSKLYLHIIVDNNSNDDYYNKLKVYFTRSIIIRRNSNGGCTSAYNDGIKYALADKNVDAIMLIGNDILIYDDSVEHLYNFLYSKNELKMVAPAILKKNSNIVESLGDEINHFLQMEDIHGNENINSINACYFECETVMGGMNLAKREFYEKLGLQDTNLFMYSDEIDMGLRAKKIGFKMAVTKTAIAWHQHINPGNRELRLPYVAYLQGRNKVYLAGKHFGFSRKYEQFLYHLFIFLVRFIRYFFNKRIRIYQLYFIKGSFNGLISNMDLSSIIE